MSCLSRLCLFPLFLQLHFCLAFVSVVSSNSHGASSSRTRNTLRLPAFRRLPGQVQASTSPTNSVEKMERESENKSKSSVTSTSSQQEDMDIMESRGIPKAETGILDLLQQYPTADGRGIKIAILDTGCDLAAAGLTTTSDGKPKYLDFIDCTGGGDVDINTTVPFDYKESQRIVMGMSGRNLTVGEWASSVKEFRMGAVRLFHLLPRSVERRVRQERKEMFMCKHKALISETQLSLDHARNPVKDGSGAKDKKRVKELEVMLDQLQSMVESYHDAGPLLDILMYHDGETDTWRAVIDLEADGDLTNSTQFAPFGVDRQIGELAFGSAVTFCIQVYDGGKTLSIVTDAGSHGTHVAGIAAANFVDEDDETGSHKAHVNGVAPGAQVLACKIGDGRLGSAETGTGLVRALIASKKYQCDLVNLSYGEPSWQPDSGRVAQTFSDAVYKWGMTVFTSAGNDGPALSSLGSPGTLSAPITVGAYVSPEMMADQYSTLPPDDDTPLEGASYYFSSRGPTPDGNNPDICAPGGAISPIPRHALQGKAQYHGTSMSSPNACGVAACVLSALKQNGVDNCGPTELRRGLVNSAKSVDISDPFAQGSGLISAVDAVNYIMAHHDKEGQSLAIDVSIPSRKNARGIYIRDALELEGPMTVGVLVQPRFNHSIKRTAEEMQELLGLELNLELKPSEPWIHCPEGMTLLSAQERNGQTFSVRLNTEDLAPGAHFATIDAIDTSHPERGSLFAVPVTVIVPHSKFTTEKSPKFEISHDEYFAKEENGDFSTKLRLTQGVPNRRFMTVPAGAEWATIKLRSTSHNPSGKSPHNVLLHAIPFVRGDLPNTRIQLKKVFQVKEGVEQEYHMRVKGGATLELCLQLLWLANPSPTSVIADIEFHSLNARAPTLVASHPVTIAAATEFARLGASANLRSEILNPKASLKFVERPIRPEKYDIKSGSTELDVLPASDAEIQAWRNEESGHISAPDGTQIYEMRVQYKFKIEGDKAIAVTPSVPSLFNQLYDSPLDSQLWVLEDCNSQILAYGGAMHHADSVSLKKGDYTLTLLLRHPSRNLLEQMKDIPCQITLDLPSPLSCKVFENLDEASTPSVTEDNRSPLGLIHLRKGHHQDIYVTRPTDDLPVWVAPGDTFVGVLTLDKDRAGGTSTKLLYVVPPKSKAKKVSEDETAAKDDEKEEDSMEDVIFKAKLSFLASIRSKDDGAYKKLAKELQEESPTSIPLLAELLLFAKKAPAPSTVTDENQWRGEEVEQVYEAMKKENDGPIDEGALAQYFGLNQLDEDDIKEDKEAKKEKKDMEEQRKVLRNTLFARACIRGEIALNNASNIDAFDESVKEMKKWLTSKDLDNDDDKIQLSIILSRHARLCQNKKATAISILLKARKELPEEGFKKITNELIQVYESLDNMDHLIENAKDELYNRYPVNKMPL